MLSKYPILNLQNFGVDLSRNLKCSYKLMCFIVDFNTFCWSPNECGSNILSIYVVTWLCFILVEIACMPVTDMYSKILTETLVCTSQMTTWRGKLDNSLDIWGFFCVKIGCYKHGFSDIIFIWNIINCCVMAILAFIFTLPPMFSSSTNKFF